MNWTTRFDELTASDEKGIQTHITAGALPPVLVVATFSDVSEEIAKSWLDHLNQQLFDGWKAVLCFRRSCSPDVVQYMRAKTKENSRYVVIEELGLGEGREIVLDLGIPRHVLVISGDVMLRKHALYRFAATAVENPEALLIYSDEDELSADGKREMPWFKPKFSPELLRHIRYLGPCVLLQNPNDRLPFLVERLFAIKDTEDFGVNIAETLPEHRVVHVKSILYHNTTRARWTAEPSSAVDLTGDEWPKVSIIIPTKDSLDLLEPCLASIERTRYADGRFEIIVVDNNSSDPDVLHFLSAAETAGRIRLLRDREAFNYSRINNRAANLSDGEILVFLNNDTEVNHPNWLRLLVHYATQNDVGVVGTKLLYPDRTVQHGGVVLGIQGLAGHAFIGCGEYDSGYQNLNNVTREISAVTGACLAMRKAVFQEVGGFDEALAVAFSDVLLCLDCMEGGYRNIFVGEPLMIHHESKLAVPHATSAKRALFHREAADTANAIKFSSRLIRITILI